MYTVAKRCRRRTVAAFWVGAASLLSAWPVPAPAQVQTYQVGGGGLSWTDEAAAHHSIQC